LVDNYPADSGRKTIYAGDLFCGGGGFSTGLLTAAKQLGVEVDLLAINHWDIAISTHSKNHPRARHICQSLEHIHPRTVVPEGRLNLLLASPECIHHSRARGGRPMNDQSRATAWQILRWAEALYIEQIIVENVPEFLEWGPLGEDDRPIKEQKGQLFQKFVECLRTLNYQVEWKILNAADYGDPTTRKRLFLRAARDGRPIVWPEPTHPKGKWRSAQECIDWNLLGKSIFNRKKPLAENTLRRIEAGLLKYSGLPFLVNCVHPSDGTTRIRDAESPLPTLTTRNNLALAQPFLIPYNSEQDGEQPRCHSVEEPLRTVCASNRFGLVQPFLVVLRNNQDAQSMEDPVPTLCASGQHVGLAQPFLLKYYGNEKDTHSVNDPLGTITSKDRFGLVHPILETEDGERYRLDVRFRMLQPHELSKAMSFPEGYEFHGNRQDKVKQIGNAVAVGVATALCSAALAN
jgi:DNA (cytosine-5)-methyltransferase 1